MNVQEELTPQPVSARNIPTDSPIPEDLQEAVDAINRARKSILQQTLDSNDPTKLNGIRQEMATLGDVIIRFLRRGDTSGMKGIPLLEELQKELSPIQQRYNFSNRCQLCSIVDTLFKQAPFTQEPSHALLLQKNISND
jgi:hypothetical protein